MSLQQKAMTIVEMIVVSVIIGIISTLIISSIDTTSRRLMAEARIVTSDLRWARARAVGTHTHHAVSFDPNNREYSIYISPTCSVADFTNANFLKRVELEATLALILNNIWFYSPTGSVYRVYGVYGPRDITLTIANQNRTITVFPETGYIRSP